MAEWKSRANKEPPARFFAEVVAYLDKSYPRASLSREVMEALRPFLAREWRTGQSAHDAAKATCACDGVTIVPSAATAVELAKGAVRPPKGAGRGQAVGIDEVREPAALTKARVDAAVAKRHVEHYSELVGKLSAARQSEKTMAKRAVKLAEATENLRTWTLELESRSAVVRELLAAASWSRREDTAMPSGSSAKRAGNAAPRKKSKKGENGGALDYTPRAYPGAREAAGQDSKRGKKAPCEACAAPGAEPPKSQDDLDALVASFSEAALQDLERGGEG